MSDITVLHVDDDPSLGDLMAEFLERENPRFTVVTETTAPDGLERIQTEKPECIVSACDLLEEDGLKFLRTCADSPMLSV